MIKNLKEGIKIIKNPIKRENNKLVLRLVLQTTILKVRINFNLIKIIK
jgi:hypothetical protein